MEIVGFNHDDLTSGGKAAYTFGMKNLMANTRQMNATETNYGSFDGSNMYAYLKDTVFQKFTSDLRSVVKFVNKKTNAGNRSMTTKTISMQIFLFSAIEISGSQMSDDASDEEGTQYAAFFNNSSRIKKLSNGVGAAQGWWTRSPNTQFNYAFIMVNLDGEARGSYAADELLGVCFGFCV